MKRHQKLNNEEKRAALVWMLAGMLIASWLYGSWHAFNQHSLQMAISSLLIPPFGLYLFSESQLGHRKARQIDTSAPVGRMRTINTLNNRCLLNNDQRRRAKLSINQYREYCRCSATSTAEILQASAKIDSGSSSDQVKQQVIRGNQSCLSTSRYLPN